MPSRTQLSFVMIPPSYGPGIFLFLFDGRGNWGTVGTVKGMPRHSPFLDSFCHTTGIQLHIYKSVKNGCRSEPCRFLKKNQNLSNFPTSGFIGICPWGNTGASSQPGDPWFREVRDKGPRAWLCDLGKWLGFPTAQLLPSLQRDFSELAKHL